MIDFNTFKFPFTFTTPFVCLQSTSTATTSQQRKLSIILTINQQTEEIMLIKIQFGEI